MKTPAGALFALCLTALSTIAAGSAGGQEAAEPEAGGADAALFDDDELDAMVAPVALYPDSLLTQVMVAATYPLDVMKADRLIDDISEATAEARAAAVEAEDWDPSVQVLASGFPTVIDRMADEIDWTERLGDAVLAQTDDVLASIQRLRAQAAATGYLASNAAQVVEVVDDSIAIEPADPDVVYVPSYDPAVAYMAAPTAGPVIATDSGLSTSTILTTGAIAFGSAFLINELFDDDDDWDNYWRAPSHIDWDDGDFRARPDVNIDGDVNVNRGRFTSVDRDRNTIDRDRVNIGDRVDGDRIGRLEGDALRTARDKGWKPSDRQRDAARDKIAARKDDGDFVRSNRPGGAGSDRATVARDKLKAGSISSGADARGKLQKAAAERRPVQAAQRSDSAFKPKASSAPDVRKAKARAESSGKAAEVRKASASRQKASKAVSRPQAAKRPATKRPPSKQTSAFKKSGGRPKAASARGKASKSKRK